MIQMMQGHALTILSEMARDNLFDAVITDPPYASGAATLSGISAKTSTKYTSSKRGNCPYPDFEGDTMDKRSWANLMLQVLLEARMRTRPGGSVCPEAASWTHSWAAGQPFWRLIWRDTMQ